MAYNSPRYFAKTFFPSYFQTGITAAPVEIEKEKVIGGGGSGFQRQSRISQVPQGTRSYKDYGRKNPSRKQDNDIIEFVVKFTTDYL